MTWCVTAGLSARERIVSGAFARIAATKSGGDMKKKWSMKKLKRWLVKKTGWHISRNPKKKKGEGK